MDIKDEVEKRTAPAVFKIDVDEYGKVSEFAFSNNREIEMVKAY